MPGQGQVVDPALLSVSGVGSIPQLSAPGAGGGGEVYRAWDPALRTDVALKLLAENPPEGVETPAQFLEEARQLAKVCRSLALQVARDGATRDERVVIDESDPPQVSLVVSSGLPNSCYEFDRYEVNQEGDEIAALDLAVVHIAQRRTNPEPVEIGDPEDRPPGKEGVPDLVFPILPGVFVDHDDAVTGRLENQGIDGLLGNTELSFGLA